MNRLLSFLIFFTIAISIYFLMHYFVFKTLSQYFPLFIKYKKILKYFFIVSGFTFPLAMILSRTLRFHLLNYYAFIWLGIIAIAFFVVSINWLIVKLFPGSAQVVTTAAVILIGVIALYSLANGLRFPVVKKVTVPIKGLAPELDGFTIIQISDLHLEPFKSNGIAPKLVETVNSMNPGLIAITGDLIEGDEICKEPFLLEQLQKLQAVHGVVAVTGNHEYFAGIETFTKLVQKANIKVLRNQVITLADSLQVVGLEDDTGRNFGSLGPDLDGAIKQCDPGKPILLLYHRPTGFDEAAAKGVDLQLSGHTHAGQIPPMDLIVCLYYKYPAGLYEKDGAYIYTSAGTGYWGPPMRFLNRSEITHITLKSVPGATGVPGN